MLLIKEARKRLQREMMLPCLTRRRLPLTQMVTNKHHDPVYTHLFKGLYTLRLTACRVLGMKQINRVGSWSSHRQRLFPMMLGSAGENSHSESIEKGLQDQPGEEWSRRIRIRSW